MTAVLERLIAGHDLDASDATALFSALTDPFTPAPLVGALLAALRAKGETAVEIAALARAMRARAFPCDLGTTDRLVDVVGTGGDGAGSFNLSTGAALLAAAAGAHVAKHGGGAVSSRSGSADVLAALGLSLPLSPPDARALFTSTGFTFLHAPYFHPALRRLAPIRRALATRTAFNLVGPLCNPAGPPFAVVGACSTGAAEAMALALSELPIERAFVIHGASGWDEPTPIGPFRLFEVTPHHVVASQRDPLAVGLARCGPDSLRGGDAADNARALAAVFHGERGAHRDALVLGAALALEVTSHASDMAGGAAMARTALDDGRAARLLASLSAFSVRDGGQPHA
jgi:anthranilate phosphoribosyltransferase